MVGKYVEKNVTAWFDGKDGQETQVLEKLVGRLVEEKLKVKGLL
jgi:riboflavin synthase